jgi:N-acetylmuramoyl-L-alanine amidase
MESSDESGPIVLNMYQTNTINLSKTFGNQVLKHLEGLSHIKHAVVQEAPFRVLKLPDIPSLLIETAFISNPGEEQMLNSGQFQQKLASAVADAIYEYSPASPSNKPKKVIATASSSREPAKATAGNKLKARFHKVRRGDTIHSIARKYDTTVSELAQLNRIKLDDPLYIGRKLKLPVSDEEKAPPKMESKNNKPVSQKDNTIVYKVKRGDTLAGIARRHNTDVASLAKTNQMKLDSPLYVGRKMKIAPADSPSQGIQQNGSEPTVTIAPKRFTYRVKMGDTFPTIAQRCNMSIDELLELNQMKFGDSLYVDQELIVLSEPADEEASTGKANGRLYH